MQGNEQTTIKPEISSDDLKLISVTRQDLSGGYQTVQTAHAVAEFAYYFPPEFKEWKEASNSIICLAVKDEASLYKLSRKLEKKGIKHALFKEPDADNQLTALAIEPSPESRKATSWIPLANKFTGEINKHSNVVTETKSSTNDLTKSDVIEKMKSTFQFKDQSVYDHGKSVTNYLDRIMDSLFNNSNDPNIKIPDHIIENKDIIQSVFNRIGFDKIKKYCIYHDIGKPFCLTIDSDGKQHFPDHAQVSYEIYSKLFKSDDDKEIADMILHDMDIHLAKPSDMDNYLKMSNDRQILHMIVGLAELLSNAQMFGGLDSTGFKIKYKNFYKLSKKIIENIKIESYENL